ncbi:hypothetical protein PI124_g5104 [Phytophthora idaei]|nr:hypothetical protein PI125_g2780 [Phytophthora idaei]KAG3169596.1 hypothetical protein PI126_g2736 [Phytophthora idaei]KAG3250234.1 hypothetical protein PI124_g5104 [Phytophthora idaei]
MFRSNWDLVSPLSWLDSLADEEEFMGRGFDESYPSTRLVFFPRAHPAQRQQRQSEEEPMHEENEEEEMETEDSPIAEEQLLMASNFFDGLPVGAKLVDTQVPSNVSPPKAKTKDGYSFFTYAYSTCLTADDNGRRVNSTRRPRRASEQDKGSHEHKVSSGTVEAFEQAWKRTPFGVAEEQAKGQGSKQSVLPDQPPAQELP